MKNREIQGLRAVAVLGVVLYHANFNWIPGGFLGVDVFFVISGYLISQMIINELSATGKISLPNFYARRLRRLLPTAILVIIATVGVGRHLISPLRHTTLGIDAIASIFYGANYRFYFSEIDYLQIGEKPSLLLHFWSLAVEEQFYLFWPILLFVGWKIFKRFGVFLTLILTMGFSFYYSLKVTESDPTLAFYSLPSRAWEFALGAITFLLVSRLKKMPKFFRWILGWSGISGLAYSMIAITDSQTFPGTIALIPTLATAGILAASSKGKFFGSFLLTNPLFYAVGAISYSLYLWHWPVYQLMTEVTGSNLSQINLAIYSLILIALTLGTYFLIEKPIRNYRRLARRASYGIIWGGATSLIGTFVAISVMNISIPYISTATASEINPVKIVASPSPTQVSEQNNIYGQLLSYPVGTTIPIDLITLENTQFDSTCQSTATEIYPKKECFYGNVNGAKNIVLFGDSHANQWVPALNQIGLKNNLKISVFTKSGCPAANLSVRWELQDNKFRDYPECSVWRKNVISQINSMPAPDLILLAATGSYNDGAKDRDFKYWVDGYSSTISELKKYSEKIMILNDTPHPGTPSAKECLSKNLLSPSKCDLNKALSVNPFDRSIPLDEIRLKYGVQVIDPTPWLCTGSTCPAVLDGIVTYFDASHLSVAMSAHLAPLLGRPILSKLAG